MLIIDSQQTETKCKLAIVVGRFNQEVTAKLLQGALDRAKERNFQDSDITVVWVPGAVEIPVVAQRLAQQAIYDAIICLGAVIRGETSHYDYVCDQVSTGCQQIALQNDLPVIFGILTTDNEAQAFDRVGGTFGHKGRDSVDVAVEMVATLKKIS